MNYEAKKGNWYLIAPDGEYWVGDSPLNVVSKERNCRIPANIQLERIMSSIKNTERDISTGKYLGIAAIACLAVLIVAALMS